MPDAPSRTDRVLSASAVVAALAAVAISAYQAHLAREQQRASAWPYVAEWNSHTAGNPYRRTAGNSGVGPALVRSVQVLADGEPQRTWGDVVGALTGVADLTVVYSSFGRGAVLPAGASRVVLTVPAGPVAERFFAAVQTRLVTRVCYCSIYGECWVADSRDEEPLAVGTCAVEPDAEFQQ
jgi:hypothetical protein